MSKLILVLFLILTPSYVIAGVNEDLLESAKAGNLVAVKNAVTKGADVNAEYFGFSALMLASMEGHLNIAKYLIKEGANKRSIDDAFALSLANNNFAIAKYLLSEGANINHREKDGDTLLIQAAGNNEVFINFKNAYKAVQFLVENGADLNIKGGMNSTALIWAIDNEKFKIAKYLIKKGADVNIKDKYGFTALIKASDCGYIEIVKLLIYKKANINAKDASGCDALKWACWHGHK